MKMRFSGLVLLAILMCGAGLVSAELTLKESFDYHRESTLDGVGSGTGWGATQWQALGGRGGIRLEEKKPASLDYPAGTSLVATGTRVNNGVNGIISIRNLDTPIELTKTHYISFLARKSSSGIFRIETINTANKRIRLGVGVNEDGTLYAQASLIKANTQPGAFHDETTYLVVLKTTMAQTSVNLYQTGVDAIPAIEPDGWLVTASASTGEMQDQMMIAVSKGRVELDELLMGDSWGSVTGGTGPASQSAAIKAAATEPDEPAPVLLPEGVDRVDIFLLMGQSNMAGRGKIPASQTENPLILSMNMATDQWVPARHPLHKVGAPDLIDGSSGVGVGPGLDFAQELVKREDGVLVALIPVAQGGSWIDLWRDGSENYEKTIRKAKKALADFPGKKVRIAGALWLQGESDTLEVRYGVYPDKLTSLIERLRSDLNEPELPFIACTIRPDIIPKGKYLHVKEINDMLLSLPERVPHTACVDARDLKGHMGDFMHYNTQSQQAIGERYAVEYLRLTGAE